MAGICPKSRTIFCEASGVHACAGNLPIPTELIEFLDGEDRSEEFVFSVVSDAARKVMHAVGKKHGYDPRGYYFPPTEARLSSAGDSIEWFSYQFYIGFIGVIVDFCKGQDYPSFFDKEVECEIVEVESSNPLMISQDLFLHFQE